MEAVPPRRRRDLRPRRERRRQAGGRSTPAPASGSHPSHSAPKPRERPPRAAQNRLHVAATRSYFLCRPCHTTSASLQSRETVLANARLVLETETVPGSLLVRDGRIAAVDTGTTVPRGAEDLRRRPPRPRPDRAPHRQPRAPPRAAPGRGLAAGSAILAHDAELAGCGITTVFDALRVGSLVDAGKVGYGKYARPIATAITAMAATASSASATASTSAPRSAPRPSSELAEFHDGDGVGIVSLMDHTPGQRQFTDIARQRTYAVGRRGLTDDEFEAHVAAMRGPPARVAPRHEAAIVAAARRLGATLASHDDTTLAHVAASAAHGARIAEFPTTSPPPAPAAPPASPSSPAPPTSSAAARTPATSPPAALADAGLLDILSSDYAPASLLAAAVALGREAGDLALGLAPSPPPRPRRRPRRPRPPRPRPRRRPPAHPPRPAASPSPPAPGSRAAASPD